MRLIDVNKLKESLVTEIYSYSKGDIRKRLFARGLSLAYDIVNRQPTVDAVEVVRCKDCKYYWKSYPHPTPDVVCLASPKDDAFCSEGERREDADT